MPVSPTAPTVDILIVIVNYQTPQLTLDCLASLEPEFQLLPQTRVVVVDNASADGSALFLQTAIADRGWCDWVQLVSSPHNGGYAQGNNLAIRPALASPQPPDYILLLNPDTVIHPQAVLNLVTFMEANPQVGIGGSRLEDPDGTPQKSAFRFPSWGSELDQGLQLGPVSWLLSPWVIAPPVADTACATDWVAGASMIVRRQVFEQVGYLDEAYFLYFEEVDFCLRAARQGWSCWYIPRSRVVHLVGQSSGVTTPTSTPKRLPPYWFESRQRFFYKNWGVWYGVIADALRLIGILLWRLRRRLQGKAETNPPYLLEDLYQQSAWRVCLRAIDPFTAIPHQWQLLREDLKVYDRDWSRPGFQAIAVHRLGAWRMRIRWKLLRLPFSLIYHLLYIFVRNVYGIELPYTVALGRGVILEHQHGIVIHGNCVIGNNCIIRQGVTLGNRYLERPFEAPVLGQRVNVGAGAKILGRVTLGDDVQIGANAVVLEDVPAGRTAVGIPARLLPLPPESSL